MRERQRERETDRPNCNPLPKGGKGNKTLQHNTAHLFIQILMDWGPTLEGVGRLLSESEVLLRQMVYWLVLVDLYTGAYVALTVQEEREGAGQVLTVRNQTEKEGQR